MKVSLPSDFCCWRKLECIAHSSPSSPVSRRRCQKVSHVHASTSIYRHTYAPHLVYYTSSLCTFNTCFAIIQLLMAARGRQGSRGSTGVSLSQAPANEVFSRNRPIASLKSGVLQTIWRLASGVSETGQNAPRLRHQIFTEVYT